MVGEPALSNSEGVGRRARSDRGVEGPNQAVSIDILDTFGKRVSASTIAVNEGVVNTSVDLKGSLAAGMYVVNITAGETVYTERLVVQP